MTTFYDIRSIRRKVTNQKGQKAYSSQVELLKFLTIIRSLCDLTTLEFRINVQVTSKVMKKNPPIFSFFHLTNFKNVPHLPICLFGTIRLFETLDNSQYTYLSVNAILQFIFIANTGTIYYVS